MSGTVKQEVFSVAPKLSAVTLGFKDVETMGLHLEGPACLYEGATATRRQGINFPRETWQQWYKGVPAKERTAVHKQLDDALRADPGIRYVIAYRQGDVQTRKHELQHAKYALDAAYRARADAIWAQLTPEQRKLIGAFLDRLGYPAKVHADEWQAYLFTESDNFFGIKLDAAKLELTRAGQS
jgi:hypothetical protein